MPLCDTCNHCSSELTSYEKRHEDARKREHGQDGDRIRDGSFLWRGRVEAC